MNIIILSHLRSLDKAVGLINAYKDENVITIITEQEFAVEEKEFLTDVDQILFVQNFNLVQITSKVSNCDKIWCISENLLPLQSQLESFYGIDNLSPYAAEILSNKQNFDDYCRSIGLKNYVPQSITPKNEQDLDIFENKKFFTKPDIGTGNNIFFPGSDNTTPLVEYRLWNNKEHFINYLKTNNLYDKFFYFNKQGICNERFNFRPCRIMAQEYIWSKFPSICPHPYVKNKKIRYSHWIKISKLSSQVTHNSSLNPIESHAFSEKDEVATHRAVWQIDEDEIDKSTLKKMKFFVEKLIENLGIKDEFFVGGPEYLIDSNQKIFAIDVNSRPGGNMSKFEKDPKRGLIYSLINEKPIVHSSKYLYGCATLKPGKIKQLKNLEFINPNFCPNNIKLENGTVIPSFQSLLNRKHRLNFKILADSQEELFAKYLELNQQLQDCIIYEDDDNT